MQSVATNSKVISTAAHQLGHDLTYLETNEARFPPTTPVQNWQAGQYLEHEVPASSSEHDVMKESYYDVIWRPVLYVKSSPAIYFNSNASNGTLTNKAPNTSGFQVKAGYAGNVGANNLSYAPIGSTDTSVLNQVGNQGPELVDLPNVLPAQSVTEVKLPLPATSGFVPSQGFFHDLFSDFVYATKNTGDIRTIRGNAGGFQYASKLLQLLDCEHSRYGTAQMCTISDARPSKPMYGPSNAMASNGPDERNTVDWGASSVGNNEYYDFLDRLVSQSKATYVDELEGAIAAGPFTRRLDAYYESVKGSIRQLAIVPGQVPAYDVLVENDEWQHMCLTVGRENPDVYTLQCIAPNYHGLYPSVGNRVSFVGDTHKRDDWERATVDNTWVGFVSKMLKLEAASANEVPAITKPLASLWALAGHAGLDDMDSKACALYRNRQVCGLRRYWKNEVWDTNSALGTINFDLVCGNRTASREKQTWFRNAYRPKDGVFNIEYDLPAYAPKRFKIQLGNFAQAYCGSPLHDWMYYCPMLFGDHSTELSAAASVTSAVAADANTAYINFANRTYKDNVWTPWLRALSPMYNASVKVDVSYGIEFQRFDLVMHRHKVSTEVEAAVRRSIMELGLARYAVRSAVTQITPVPPVNVFDAVLFENTAADIVFIAVMRNLALNFNQSIANAQLNEYLGSSDGVAKLGVAGPMVQIANAHLQSAKFIDSFASAPLDYVKSKYIRPVGDKTLDSKAIAPWGEPSLKINEMALLVNGQKDPNLGYQPDLASADQITVGQDMIYKKVINELVGAGYNEAASILPKAVWESNVRIFPFNLTRSKFAVKSQGSNLAQKRHIAIQLQFQDVVPANRYSVVAVAITSATQLSFDSSGNCNYLY